MKRIFSSIIIATLLFTSCTKTTSSSPSTPITSGTTDSSFITINYPGSLVKLEKSAGATLRVTAQSENDHSAIQIYGSQLPSNVFTIEAVKYKTNLIVGTYSWAIDSGFGGGINTGSWSGGSTLVHYKDVLGKLSVINCTRFDANYIAGSYTLNCQDGSNKGILTGEFLIKR